jgi:hypothetical protein
MNELWRCIEGEYEEEEIVRVKKAVNNKRKIFLKRGKIGRCVWSEVNRT